MDKPFPGMDPYLERPSFWPDVHHRLISALCDDILNQLQPHYTAVITPYLSFESIDITPVRTAVVPDVAVLETDATNTPRSTVLLAPPPLTVTALMDVPTRYARLEIRSVDDETLITAIEVLSPVNKRAGYDGADAYERKRQEIFRSAAHLIEIDLLRAGKRPQTTTELPDAPYFILLSRAERRPQLDVWPLMLQAPIKPIGLPLRHPDPDIVLDLGAALDRVYRSARYERRIDYHADPPPPALSDADATWLYAHLRERGLRT